MGFLFDLPLIVTGPALLLILVGGSNLGLNWFRKHVHRRLRYGEFDGDFNSAMVASIMVFYGLASALIAVNTWEVYEKVKEVTHHEAASLAVLYRNVSEYPEPLRGVLRDELRAYTHQIIHDSWPLQRKGRIPIEGVRSMNRFQSLLFRFEPVTEAQKSLVLETLSSFSRMMEARRMRVDSVSRRLPGVMWLVIVAGAFISLTSAFFFPVLDARAHHAQVGLLAAFIGVVIFMIMALDRPFDGDLALTPEPYETVYQHLMTP